MMSKLVIFGASGFVGKPLLPMLDAQGIPYAAPSSKTLDLTADTAPAQIAELVQDGDSILMLCALTPEKGKAPDLTLRNVQMVKNLLAGLEARKSVYCTYISSDAVYPLTADIINEHTPPAPDRSYGHMHILREQLLVEAFAPETLTILRPCAIYGVGDTHNAYGISRFMRSAIEQGEISLFGGGEEYRDHIHVDDLARLIAHLQQKKIPGLYNVATGASRRFIDIARLIQSSLAKPVTISHKPRAMPITHRHMNMTQLWSTFPLHRPRPIDTGIKQLLGVQ